jgi:trk system potassium uptake protein TrkA
VAVVAIGEDLEASILGTMNVKTIGVPTVWVKALSETHARILKRLGADRVIEAEREMALHVAQSLHTPFVLDYIRIGESAHLVYVKVPEALDGRDLASFELVEQYGVRFLGRVRGDAYFPPEGDDLVLRTGDRLLLLGPLENLRRLEESL